MRQESPPEEVINLVAEFISTHGSSGNPFKTARESTIFTGFVFFVLEGVTDPEEAKAILLELQAEVEGIALAFSTIESIMGQ